ncbi:hypothetical protein Nepgr_001655 [Nepenthes gracilis]|uniref:BHLH domain-containing protein n=1 Tax=Nepenthes gracilis TaxID=150966 RepID=A0AAD3P4V6_NEPGR|nr:hypothetical protein Nepgr_001655 [Nepenthes gracilis]
MRAQSGDGGVDLRRKNVALVDSTTQSSDDGGFKELRSALYQYCNMPFSELFRMAKGRVDVSQHKTSNTVDFSCGPDNDLVELVWQNGQIVLQDQSSRSRKDPDADYTQSTFPKYQDVRGPNDSKAAKFGTMDSLFNDFALPVPSFEMGLDQGVEIGPWFNYPIGESLQNDYCSDFLHESSGVTANQISPVNNLASLEKSSSFNQATRDAHANSPHNAMSLQQECISKASLGAVELERARIIEVSPLMHFQHTMPRSGISDIPSNKASNGISFVGRTSSYSPSSVMDSTGVKTQKHDASQPSSSSGFMNFSHFSRPAALARAALRRMDATVCPVSNSSERIGTEGSSNPPKPTRVNLSGGSLQKEAVSHTQHRIKPVNGANESLPSKPTEDPLSANQAKVVCRKEAAESDKFLNQAPPETAVKAPADGEKTVELVVAVSSVCSGSSVERASNDTHDLKRKCCETGDSEGPSDEVEEESVGVRKAAPARTGAKRSRAAEVHNLSERRRRDRINEKMRALQELIPNSNKADKASMLDEAIEYLKTLQLQVQILSMGAGLYMPSMMLPAGMQQMYGTYLPHFSPMGLGMGMGMGFGVNMLDVNSGIMQVPPPIQAPHYKVALPPVSGSSSFHGMGGSSLLPSVPVGQGLSMPVPCSPLLQESGSARLKLTTGPNVSWMATSADVLHSAPSTGSKDPMPTVGSQLMPTADVHNSMIQAKNEGIQRFAVLHDQIQAVNASEAPNHGSGNNTAPS